MLKSMSFDRTEVTNYESVASVSIPPAQTYTQLNFKLERVRKLPIFLL